jgi:hypothetical protein
MKIITRCAVLGVMFAGFAMLMQAQENRRRTSDSDDNRTPRQQHAAPPQRREPDARPAQVQRTPPPDRRMQREVPQSRPRQEAPVRAPQMRQERPNNMPVNRTPQAAPGAQPWRTFGGNAPGRAPEPAHRQPEIGARRMAPPPRTLTTRTGDVIHRDSGGQVRQVRMSNGTVVYHPPNAPRRVEVVRPGGRVVVASAPGHGYVQRSVVVRNTTIIKRTYIYNGVPQARIYRPRVYNGITLAVYTPVHYYHPRFYAYAYNPWPRPIAYRWGWGSSPWYGYYGGYFTPYPVYASPSLWLADFLIASTLEAAYQERMAAHYAAAGNNYADSGQSAPMTPEVKQAIADEVRRQIDRERAQGQTGAQDTALFADGGPHVFVANAALAVNSDAGECSIEEGDVLQMNGAPPPGSTSAELVVLSSRGQDCRKGSRVSVPLQDLQEMQNQMQATIDRGLGDLQAKQGQGGLPTLPQGSTGTIASDFAQEAQPDTNAVSELTGVTQEADRAEQQAVSEAGEEAPPTLALGQTIEAVKAIQGEPEKIVDLGSKKIYVYRDLKITFNEGTVSDIE